MMMMAITVPVDGTPRSPSAAACVRCVVADPPRLRNNTSATTITIMAGIREHLALCDVPAPLRGPGITLFVAGILALAFMGFAGMMR